MKLLRIFFPQEVRSSSPRKRRWRSLGVRRTYLGAVHKKTTKSKLRTSILAVFQEWKCQNSTSRSQRKFSKTFFLKETTHKRWKRAAPHSQGPTGRFERCCTKKWHFLSARALVLGVLKTVNTSKTHENLRIGVALQFFMKLFQSN